MTFFGKLWSARLASGHLTFPSSNTTPSSTSFPYNTHSMNLRIFLTTSSLALLGWLTASYFSAVPIEGYLSDDQTSPAPSEDLVLGGSSPTLTASK